MIIVSPAQWLGSGVFAKADPSSVAFICPTAQTVSLKAGTEVFVAGFVRRFLVDTSVTLPTLAAGTDYAIYACADGTLQASANFSAPSGYTTANSRKIGGFHYAAGSNAAAQAGGDAIPQINPYSLWDSRWRPACADPRGMALVAGKFWVDIYLTGTDVDANGSSRYGVTIADQSSPPKVPVMFGGDGSTTYGSFNWYQAQELLGSVGKSLPSIAEFALAAYGTSEGVSRGSDPVTTGLSTTNVGSSNPDVLFTSKWGVVQATGCMYQPGSQISQYVSGTDYAAATAFSAKTGAGRGALTTQGTYGLAVPRLGGYWSSGTFSGSRSAELSGAPWSSAIATGARGRADHVWSI